MCVGSHHPNPILLLLPCISSRPPVRRHPSRPPSPPLAPTAAVHRASSYHTTHAPSCAATPAAVVTACTCPYATSASPPCASAPLSLCRPVALRCRRQQPAPSRPCGDVSPLVPYAAEPALHCFAALTLSSPALAGEAPRISSSTFLIDIFSLVRRPGNSSQCYAQAGPHPPIANPDDSLCSSSGASNESKPDCSL